MAMPPDTRSRCFELRCRSKRGVLLTNEELDFVQDCFNRYPEDYRAMGREVFDYTRPFGSDPGGSVLMPLRGTPSTDRESANLNYAERTCRKQTQRGWKNGVIEKVVRGKGGRLRAKVLWDGSSPTYEDLLDLTVS